MAFGAAQRRRAVDLLRRSRAPAAASPSRSAASRWRTGRTSARAWPALRRRRLGRLGLGLLRRRARRARCWPRRPSSRASVFAGAWLRPRPRALRASSASRLRLGLRLGLSRSASRLGLRLGVRLGLAPARRAASSASASALPRPPPWPPPRPSPGPRLAPAASAFAAAASAPAPSPRPRPAPPRPRPLASSSFGRSGGSGHGVDLLLRRRLRRPGGGVGTSRFSSSGLGLRSPGRDLLVGAGLGLGCSLAGLLALGDLRRTRSRRSPRRRSPRSRPRTASRLRERDQRRHSSATCAHAGHDDARLDQSTWKLHRGACPCRVTASGPAR